MRLGRNSLSRSLWRDLPIQDRRAPRDSGQPIVCGRLPALLRRDQPVVHPEAGRKYTGNIDMNFRKYLETRYKTACEIQRHIRLDPPMIAMLQNGPPNAVLVLEWMTNYRLFQGITAENRVTIAKCFLKFAAQHERFDHEPNATEIQAMYAALFEALYGAVPRSWASATTKLLWCLYPQTVVIYDAFVLRTLSVMQCLDDSLASFPRIGGSPSIRTVNDIQVATQHYMNYQAMVCKLLSDHSHLLQELRSRHAESYPYDVRIIDKLLWMIGNPREAY